MDKKYAIRKLVRGEDGTMQLQYVDAATGEVINNLEGYTVYSIHEAQQAGINITQATTNTPKNTDSNDQTTAERIVSQVTSQSDDGNIEHVGDVGSSRGFFDRTPGNNYGYIDTPNWLSLAGFLPVVGGAAKFADRAAGLNNTVAANTAREGMGIDPLGIVRSLGNILGLRDESTIANVKINDKPYSVGFEALNAKGQTTLTPEEARKRAALGGGMKEMAPRDSREWQKDFNKEYPQSNGSQQYPDAPSNYDGPTTRGSGLEGLVPSDYSPAPSYPDAPSDYSGPTTQGSGLEGLVSSPSDTSTNTSSGLSGWDGWI